MTESDSTFRSDYHPLTDDRSGIETEQLYGAGYSDLNSQPDVETRLDLLLPADLPVEHPLNASERTEIHHLLVNLLHALQLQDRRESLRRFDGLLRGLKHAETYPSDVGETGTPVTAAQVDDFDAYFRVNRITSNKPALSLVRGLLQTSHAVISLFCSTDTFPERQMQDQIAGFISYAHLLARTFELGELT